MSEQEQIINESIIRPDAILRYEGHVAIRDSARHPSANTAEVRLSSFGVDKVFPRFKVQSGQKENTFEDTSGSQGEDLGSDCVSTKYLVFLKLVHMQDFFFFLVNRNLGKVDRVQTYMGDRSLNYVLAGLY